jgi:hypothetical protein
MMNARHVTEIIRANPDLVDAYINRAHFKTTIDQIRMADQASVLTDEMLVDILLSGLACASNAYQHALDHAVEISKRSIVPLPTTENVEDR